MIVSHLEDKDFPNELTLMKNMRRESNKGGP